MKKILLYICFLLLPFSSSGQWAVGYAGAIFPSTVGNCSSSYLTETCTYLLSDSALTALDSAKKDAIDRWFRDIKGEANGSYTTYNVYNKLFAVYLMIGGTSTSVAVNAINPGTYNLTHTNSPTITTNGIAYTGTVGAGQYSSTGFTPSNSADSTDLICHGVHRRDANEDLDATIGIATGAGGLNYHLIRSDNYRAALIASQNPTGSAGTLAVASLWVGSYTRGTTVNYYRDGANVKTAAVLSIGNAGTSPYFIGACDDGAAPYIYGGPSTVDHVFLARYFWTDAEQTFWYDAFNALQTALGR